MSFLDVLPTKSPERIVKAVLVPGDPSLYSQPKEGKQDHFCNFRFSDSSKAGISKVISTSNNSPHGV